MKRTYHCQTYHYDQYDRNPIHQDLVVDIQTYIAYLNANLPHWDEFDITTQPDPLAFILGEEGDRQFIGKVVNPKSNYIIIAQK